MATGIVYIMPEMPFAYIQYIVGITLALIYFSLLRGSLQEGMKFPSTSL